MLHLVGSAVSEFYCDLSRLYAQGCLEATHDPVAYEVHIAYVTPDRRWRFPADLERETICRARPMSLAQALEHLTSLEVDVIVPQMFCVPGMTHYRALAALLEIPYVGNTPAVMALTANKARAKAVVAASGVSVASGEVLRPGERPTVQPPAVIKPIDSDNSIGVGFVGERADYDRALDEAFAQSAEVLVETYIELGREVRCGILVQDGRLVCLPLEEYSVRKPIRDYDDKIRRTVGGDLQLVAKDRTRAWSVDAADPVTEAVWAAARLCHVALGCRHYSLFDFRIDPGGHPWFLEAGLYCSFAPSSVISTMARASGTSTEDLFRLALTNAVGENDAARVRSEG